MTDAVSVSSPQGPGPRPVESTGHAGVGWLPGTSQAAYDEPMRDAVSRRVLIVPLVVVAALLWIAVPSFAAAGLALDHPAWSSPEVDPPSRPLAVDRQSWWPPGLRYVWTGQSTGSTIERVDPWGAPNLGHAWTAGMTAVAGSSVPGFGEAFARFQGLSGPTAPTTTSGANNRRTGPACALGNDGVDHPVSRATEPQAPPEPARRSSVDASRSNGLVG